MKMIDVENLTSLELLKTHWIYTDDFEKLPKEKQEEIYRYCKLHITNDYCKVLISRLFEQKNERTSQIKLINIIKQLK